eukprot:Gb_02903 [translate_table: standard]
MVDHQQIQEFLDTCLNLDGLDTDALDKHGLESPNCEDNRSLPHPSFFLQQQVSVLSHSAENASHYLSSSPFSHSTSNA